MGKVIEFDNANRVVCWLRRQGKSQRVSSHVLDTPTNCKSRNCALSQSLLGTSEVPSFIDGYMPQAQEDKDEIGDWSVANRKAVCRDRQRRVRTKG